MEHMANEVKPLVKTLRYRVKDGVSGRHLNAAARAVNTVWNHCNGAQRHALKHNTKWPTTGQLQRLTAGAGRLIGIPAQTVPRVCEEYIDRRRKAKLRRRGKRSLGWVPFKNQTVRVVGLIVHFNGRRSDCGCTEKSRDASSPGRSRRMPAGAGTATS